MKSLVLGLLLLVVVSAGGVVYWHFAARTTFPPTSDVCFEMLTSSLEAARSNASTTVPDFSMGSVRYVRCAAIAGMTNFTLQGTDALGKEFHIYETIGGRAASGADTLFDYCYTQDGKVISQIRITGREGKRSDSACAYDAALVPHPAYSYTYGT